MATEEELELAAKDRRMFFWGRHSWYAFLYDFLLTHTSSEFRFYEFSRLPYKERLRKAEEFLKVIRGSPDFPVEKLEDLVGYRQPIEEMQRSIAYHVFEQREGIEIPPPKVFAIKGQSGTGKTMLAKAIQRWAVEEGVKHGVLVHPANLIVTQVISMWLGQSAKQMDSVLYEALVKPSVLIIDEAHGLFAKIPQIDTTRDEMERTQSVFIQRTDTLTKRPYRSIFIFLTDKMENLIPPIRRRAQLIDLDSIINPSLLKELLLKLIGERKLSLDPEKAYEILGRTISYMGYGQMVPADIKNALDYVVSKREKNPDIDLYEVLVDSARYLRSYRMEEIGQNILDCVQVIKPNLTLNDVGGYFQLKHKLLTQIRYALDRDLVQKLGYEPPRAFLFHGPPGVGKTYLTKAIAATCDATFFYVPSSLLLTSKTWTQSPEENVKQLFMLARQRSPAIIFFDEGEIIAKPAYTDPLSSRIMSQLSVEMDGLHKLINVIVIMATNYLEMIEPRIRDRFEPNVIEFRLPVTDAERESIQEVHLRRLRNKIAKPFIHPEVTPKSVVQVLKKKAVVSPRVQEQVVLEAHRLWVEELEHAKLLDNGPFDYKEPFRRLLECGQFYKDEGVKIPLSELTPDNWGQYLLRLYHFERAAELLEKEAIKEIRRIEASFFPEKGLEEGMVAGIWTIPEYREGGVVPVECVISNDGLGKVEVYGVQPQIVMEHAAVDEPYMKASASMARFILLEVLKEVGLNGNGLSFFWNFRSHGLASGPSAGMAFVQSGLSRLAKIKAKFIPMTGTIDLFGNMGVIGGVGGSDTGKLLGVLSYKKHKVEGLVVPPYNYNTSKDYWIIFKERGIPVYAPKNYRETAEIVFGMKWYEILEQIRQNWTDKLPKAAV